MFDNNDDESSKVQLEVDDNENFLLMLNVNIK